MRFWHIGLGLICNHWLLRIISAKHSSSCRHQSFITGHGENIKSLCRVSYKICLEGRGECEDSAS